MEKEERGVNWALSANKKERRGGRQGRRKKDFLLGTTFVKEGKKANSTQREGRPTNPS